MRKFCLYFFLDGKKKMNIGRLGILLKSSYLMNEEEFEFWFGLCELT